MLGILPRHRPAAALEGGATDRWPRPQDRKPRPIGPYARAHRKPRLSSRESRSEPRPSALRASARCRGNPCGCRAPAGVLMFEARCPPVPARPGPGGRQEAPPTLLAASERFVPTAWKLRSRNRPSRTPAPDTDAAPGPLAFPRSPASGLGSLPAPARGPGGLPGDGGAGLTLVPNTSALLPLEFRAGVSSRRGRKGLETGQPPPSEP